jgi:hypothetical protein
MDDVDMAEVEIENSKSWLVWVIEGIGSVTVREAVVTRTGVAGGIVLRAVDGDKCAGEGNLRLDLRCGGNGTDGTKKSLSSISLSMSSSSMLLAVSLMSPL